MSLLVYAPFMHKVFLTSPINGKYIALSLPIIPIMVTITTQLSTCSLTHLDSQIGVEELRKKVVLAYPAAIKHTDAKGAVVLRPNPHPASLLAKLTQY
jgi:hypothetical protein